MVGLRTLAIVVGSLVAACDARTTNAPSPTPTPTRPILIAFGDCAPTEVAWVSGPRPAPFTPEEARDARNRMLGTGQRPDAADDGQPVYGGLVGTLPGELRGGSGYPKSRPGLEEVLASGLRAGRGGPDDGFGGAGGGMRGGGAARPRVSIGQATVKGDLEEAVLRRYLRRDHRHLVRCYERALTTNPALAGTVTATFQIASKGRVRKATAAGMHAGVASCVAGVLERIPFPPPRRGGVVDVRYPLTFDTEPPADPVAGGAPPDGAHRHLFRASALPAAQARGYRPGAHNPLRAALDPLATCLQTHAEPYGVGVVELAYDGAGAVTSAAVHGMTAPSTMACIVAAARTQVRRAAGSAAASERCAFAYGEMPASALPALEVALDGVKLAGTTIVDGAAVQRDAPQIPELIAAIERRQQAATAANAPVVALYGPLVLRAAAATPMAVIDRAAFSVAGAGDDLVFAIEQPGWVLLPGGPSAVPVVPVPFGTGTRWYRAKANWRDTTMRAEDDDLVQLSIVIAKNRTWIGLSRVGESQEVPEAEVAARLGEILQQLKQSAFFVDRAALEIAAEGDATYGQFARTVEAAVAAGFTEWQHLPLDAVTARPAR